MERYPLRFGMASYAAWYGNEGPRQITEYQVESDRQYPVRVGVRSESDDPWGGTSRDAGVAKVGGDPGAFWVEFETAEQNPRFYSVWRVAAGGIASLTDILMATGPYTTR